MTISLEQSVYSVAEADGFVEVCAVLQGQLARDVNVELRTEGDTASEFIDVCMKFTYPCQSPHIRTIYFSLCVYKLLALVQDFGDVMTILTFTDQRSRQCVNISIAMDGIVEPEESFNVVLETSDPAVVLGTSTAQVLIADSDGKWV